MPIAGTRPPRRNWPQLRRKRSEWFGPSTMLTLVFPGGADWC
jgi:hypothetical protein